MFEIDKIPPLSSIESWKWQPRLYAHYKEGGVDGVMAWVAESQGPHFPARMSWALLELLPVMQDAEWVALLQVIPELPDSSLKKFPKNLRATWRAHPESMGRVLEYLAHPKAPEAPLMDLLEDLWRWLPSEEVYQRSFAVARTRGWPTRDLATHEASLLPSIFLACDSPEKLQRFVSRHGPITGQFLGAAAYAFSRHSGKEDLPLPPALALGLKELTSAEQRHFLTASALPVYLISRARAPELAALLEKAQWPSAGPAEQKAAAQGMARLFGSVGLPALQEWRALFGVDIAASSSLLLQAWVDNDGSRADELEWLCTQGMVLGPVETARPTRGQSVWVSPLHEVIRRGAAVFRNNVDVLLAHGADPKFTNGSGQTAHDLIRATAPNLLVAYDDACLNALVSRPAPSARMRM